MPASATSNDAASRPDFIQVDEFSFHYGPKQALFDIHMDIPEH